MRNVNAVARRQRGAEVLERDSSNNQVRAAGTIDLTADQDRSRRTGTGGGAHLVRRCTFVSSRTTARNSPVLLDARGGVVSRDELRTRLWPGDTFVDFEHGVNAAVKRPRVALGDNADSPRFIESRPPA